MKCYIWGIAFCGAVTWTLRKVDQKYLENFEMWCWRRFEISWNDRVKNVGTLRGMRWKGIYSTYSKTKVG
jgi:hypothetical protein